MPAGGMEFNPITVLQSSVLSNLIKNVEGNYNVILVSCADIKNYPDPVILSSHLDGVILIVNEGRSRRQVVKNAITPLQETKTNLVGAILNNRTHALPGFIYKLT